MKAIATKRKPSSTTVNGAKRPSTTVNRLLANPATSAARRRSSAPRLHPSAAPSLQDSLPPFDPALPLDGSLIVAEVLRDQFNALDDDIQTRVTQAAFSAEVQALGSAIAHCVPESEFDEAVSGLTGQIDQRATQTDLNNAVNALNEAIGIRVTHSELNDVVDGLNSAIDQRITQAQLNAGMDAATNNAINAVLPQTSANTNAVATLDMTISDPPTQSEVAAMLGKLNELINALRR